MKVKSSVLVAQIECVTDAIGDLPEARDALRNRPVQHFARSDKIDPEAAPDLIRNLHAAHRNVMAS